jgi:hypothetical protein
MKTKYLKYKLKYLKLKLGGSNSQKIDIDSRVDTDTQSPRRHEFRERASSDNTRGSAVSYAPVMKEYTNGIDLININSCNELLCKIIKIQRNKHKYDSIDESMVPLFIIPNGNCLFWSYIIATLLTEEEGYIIYNLIIDSFNEYKDVFKGLKYFLKNLYEPIKDNITDYSSDIQGDIKNILEYAQPDLEGFGTRYETPDYSELGDKVLSFILSIYGIDEELPIGYDYTQIGMLKEIFVKAHKFVIIQEQIPIAHYSLCVNKLYIDKFIGLSDDNETKKILCKIFEYSLKWLKD